jgi:hypothetical protein
MSKKAKRHKGGKGGKGRKKGRKIETRALQIAASIGGLLALGTAGVAARGALVTASRELIRKLGEGWSALTARAERIGEGVVDRHRGGAQLRGVS